MKEKGLPPDLGEFVPVDVEMARFLERAHKEGILKKDLQYFEVLRKRDLQYRKDSDVAREAPRIYKESKVLEKTEEVDLVKKILYVKELARHNFEPPDARYFDVQEKESILKGGTGALFQTLASYILPPQTEGILRWFGQNSSDSTWTYLEWRIVIAGAPAPPYQMFNLQLGTITVPTEVFFFVTGGQSIKLEVRNIDTSKNFDATGRIKGWFWPLRSGSIETTK